MQKSISVLIILAVGIGLVFSGQIVHGEKNTSISKERPQADEIKTKLKVKAIAAEQKRKADLEVLKQQKAVSKLNREADKNTPLSEKIMMQYKMPDKAKQEKEELKKIMNENHKKITAKKLKIEKLVKSGKIQMHEKKTIEYENKKQ